MSPVLVVCALIFADGRLLCAKRSKEMTLAGFWEFPGGKVEENENEKSALIREIKEELAILVRPTKRLSPSRIAMDGGRPIELIPYICRWISGELKAEEHEEVNFYSLEEAKKLKWAPADVPILNELLILFPEIAHKKSDP